MQDEPIVKVNISGVLAPKQCCGCDTTEKPLTQFLLRLREGHSQLINYCPDCLLKVLTTLNTALSKGS